MLRKPETESLCRHAGRVLLIVNTASRCGYTRQFEGLEKLYQTYQNKGLTVLGFPSNDFRQELEDDTSIASFCRINYGVTFPMYSKSAVKGADANGLYQGLIQDSGQAPTWNFNKYLVDREGTVATHFPSSVRPESDTLIRQIESLLGPEER
ncbi:MAG: glutathione peroxidase [Ketobacteraceae bacterium]|nr:glutathione peroxidase [Ketobacteraceae bacterium]